MSQPDPNVRDTVRMPEPAIRAFLDFLDRQETSEARLNGDIAKRSTRRHRFPSLVPVTLEILRPGEGTVRFAVVPRNLSKGGMSIVHGVFLHPHSECVIHLRTVDGEKTVVEGVLTRCRYVGAKMHETGIKFHREVDPNAYLVLCEDEEPPKSKAPLSATPSVGANIAPAIALAEELVQLVRSRASAAVVERVLDQIRSVYPAA